MRCAGWRSMAGLELQKGWNQSWGSSLTPLQYSAGLRPEHSATPQRLLKDIARKPSRRCRAVVYDWFFGVKRGQGYTPWHVPRSSH